MMRTLILLAAVAVLLAGCHEPDRFRATSSGSQEAPVAPVPAPGAAEPPAPAQPALRSVTSLSGSGFVWKPVSEGDGNLVVLLPATAGDVLVGVNTERGRYVGRTNGNRPTYRFSRPGGAYPPGSVLTIGSLQLVVPVPGRRYD